jgi:hypothetical protein
MSRVVKTVVMWLIALAIPAQGMAAVVMPFCSPTHHMDTRVRLDPHTAHRSHAAGMAAQADHEMHQGPAATPDGVKPAGHPMLKCCSAACAMAAVIPQTLAQHVRARPPLPQQPVARLHPGVTPEGLDRPPKTVLA